MNNILEKDKKLIYLLVCSINNIKPDENIVNKMDLEELYKYSKFHMVSASVYVALKSIGIENDKFNESLNKSIRNTILFDIERQKIFKEFEQNKIWYLPLKGIIIKDMYPQNGMREMSDNDILYDKSRQQDVKRIMEKNGYNTESIGVLHHDTYTKPPVLSFELHTALFGKASNFSTYYRNIEQKLLKDKDNLYGYHFSDEEFYIYMALHEYKHYSNYGIGIRCLLDCYVYLKEKKDSLDWSYIKEQMEKLGIYDYEEKRRKISEKIFSSIHFPELTNEEEKMLLYFLHSGVYGTRMQKIENELEKEKIKHKHNFKMYYILDRMFPSYKEMKMNYPKVCKCRILLPVAYFYRMLRNLIRYRDNINLELKQIKKSRNQ